MPLWQTTSKNNERQDIFKEYPRYKNLIFTDFNNYKHKLILFLLISFLISERYRLNWLMLTILLALSLGTSMQPRQGFDRPPMRDHPVSVFRWPSWISLCRHTEASCLLWMSRLLIHHLSLQILARPCDLRSIPQQHCISLVCFQSRWF